MRTQPFKYKPFSKKQRKVLKWWMDNSPDNDYDGIIADGAIRSGKTVSMSLSFVVWSMNNFNEQNFAMCGKTVGSFRRNVLFLLRVMLESGGYSVEEKRSDNLFIVRCGEIQNYFYIFGGRDERSQDLIQGITLAGVLLDEVALMPESFVNQATGRCSVDGSKLWFSCNPEGPFHWFKTEWIDKRDEKQLLYLHFTMEDNLSLSEKVKERYRRMYSGVFYDRYVLGLWKIAEGLIYPMFDESCITPTEDRQYSRYVISMDYGIQNPTAMLLWGLSGGVWYQVKEYYHSGRETGIQKTDQEYYDELENLAGDLPIENLIIDPSATSFIALVKQKHRFKIRRAKNDVLDGISKTASSLQLGLIKVNDCCENTIKEYHTYAWDENKDDTPIKENDHCVVGDTLVRTEKGYAKIKDLVGKDGNVYSYNEETKQAELKKFYSCRRTREKAPIYEVVLKDGRKLKCTGDHPILTERGYVCVEELQATDKVVEVDI